MFQKFLRGATVIGVIVVFQTGVGTVKKRLFIEYTSGVSMCLTAIVIKAVGKIVVPRPANNNDLICVTDERDDRAQ
jgi:putative Mn2+ efflux pump MntP